MQLNIIDWAKNIMANKKTNVLWFVSTNKRALNKQSFDFYVVNTKNIKLIGSYKINDFGEKAKSFNNFIDDKYEGKRVLYEKDNISLDYGIVAKY